MMKIYIMKIQYLEEEAAYLKYEELVCSSRRKKAGRFYKASDRALSLGAGLLLEYAFWREGIRRECPLSYAFHTFEKPYLKNCPELFFNLSHSGKYAVCAVQNKGEIGIDIEQMADVDTGIARQCFTQEENAFIFASEDPMESFYRIWVLKEAYIKALGQGLNKPLKDFSIIVGKEICLKDKEETGEWFFKEYVPAVGCRMAVCSSRKDFPPVVQEVTEGDLCRMQMAEAREMREIE